MLYFYDLCDWVPVTVFTIYIYTFFLISKLLIYLLLFLRYYNVFLFNAGVYPSNTNMTLMLFFFNHMSLLNMHFSPSSILSKIELILTIQRDASIARISPDRSYMLLGTAMVRSISQSLFTPIIYYNCYNSAKNT